jgi:hypothetical protein
LLLRADRQPHRPLTKAFGRSRRVMPQPLRPADIRRSACPHARQLRLLRYRREPRRPTREPMALTSVPMTPAVMPLVRMEACLPSRRPSSAATLNDRAQSRSTRWAHRSSRGGQVPGRRSTGHRSHRHLLPETMHSPRSRRHFRRACRASAAPYRRKTEAPDLARRPGQVVA